MEKCRSAVMEVALRDNHVNVQMMAELAYFLQLEAREWPASEQSFDKWGKAIGTVPAKLDRAESKHAGELLVACEQAHPLARSNNATLPSDAFDRDLTCLVAGVATAGSAGDGQAKQDVEDRAFGLRIKQFFKDRVVRLYPDKITSLDALDNLLMKALLSSTAIGNTYAIANACDKIAQ